MTHDEMRAIRRDFINEILHIAHKSGFKFSLDDIKYTVRCSERDFFGHQLQAYK